MQIIAQTVDVIVANPPMEALRNWWPVIVTVAAGLWSWWQSYQANRWSNDAKERASKLELETERLKMEYEQRKEFVNDLMEECQKLRAECEKQRDENQKLRHVINERDETISEMRKKIKLLEDQLMKIQEEVTSLEKTRERMGEK
jgi:polyhydroxyalkanoate synthesis regulator phasin